MPEPEHTDVVDRLRAFAGDVSTDDGWQPLLTKARGRRRRRSLTGIVAAAAAVAVAAGGVALARRPGDGGYRSGRRLPTSRADTRRTAREDA